MIFDKKVDGGCSLRRPDVLIDRLTHSIINEGDEEEHKGYICEEKHIMELFRDLGNRPLVVLRFNFDSYYDGEEKHPSCFIKTDTGFSLNKSEWNRRINVLYEEIEKHMEVPEKELTIVYLFYSK